MAKEGDDGRFYVVVSQIAAKTLIKADKEGASSCHKLLIFPALRSPSFD